jgi:phage tail sheath gpL-like
MAFLPSTYKRPVFAARITHAAGAITAASVALACLIIDVKTSSGSLVADTDVQLVTTEEQVDTYAGAGSPLACGGYQGVSVPGAKVYLAAVTEPSGGTAATATLAIGSTGTASGTLAVYIAGRRVEVSYAAAATPTTIGQALADAVNAKTRLPVTAASVSGTVTFTYKVKGTQGLACLIFLDRSAMATGYTLTLTGSAAEGTDRVRMGASSTGTGTPDITTLLTKLQTTRFARIASGPNDATNAALLETHIDSKAVETKMLYEHAFFGHNGTYASANSLAQTTLNAKRCAVKWARNAECLPIEISAKFAAESSVRESNRTVTPGDAGGWNPDWNSFVLKGLPGQRFDADVPTDTEQDTALNNSVTPLTTVNGEVRIVRAITSYSKLGSTPDYRCLDRNNIVSVDACTLDLKLAYDTEFRPKNRYATADPAPEVREPKSGIAYPSLYKSFVMTKLQGYADDLILEDPVDADVTPAYNATAKGIDCTIVMRPLQIFQIVQNDVRQVTPG